MRIRGTVDVPLYRDILRMATRADRDRTQGEDSERERWRDGIRSLMVQQIRWRTGIVEEDLSLEGFVGACEGHNYDVAQDMIQYAILNAKDVTDQVRLLLGQGKPVDATAREDDEEEEEGAEVEAQDEGKDENLRLPGARDRNLNQPAHPVPCKRWEEKETRLANLFARARWAR